MSARRRLRARRVVVVHPGDEFVREEADVVVVARVFFLAIVRFDQNGDERLDPSTFDQVIHHPRQIGEMQIAVAVVEIRDGILLARRVTRRQANPKRPPIFHRLTDHPVLFDGAARRRRIGQFTRCVVIGQDDFGMGSVPQRRGAWVARMEARTPVDDDAVLDARRARNSFNPIP